MSILIDLLPRGVPSQALIFGLISAASLPLGALVALFWIPRPRVTAAMMAFGGGALLAALTLDLVGEAIRKHDFYALAVGCLLGCVVFVVLNQVVNERGGFLRSFATTIEFLAQRKSEHVRSLAERLSSVPMFRALPPDLIADLLPQVQERTYQPGTTIIRQGELGDSFFVIDQGEVDFIDERDGGRRMRTLYDHDAFGEMALLTGEPRSATAVAVKETRVWSIFKEQFDRLLDASPDLAQTVRGLATQRGATLQGDAAADRRKTAAWVHAATADLATRMAAPTNTEVREAAARYAGAPLAIWLGILLDGIPESLVIGSSLLQATISASLIAGLFLSNFPEALSSSVGMIHQRYSRRRIFLLWMSLMLMTGLGAYFGAILFQGMSHSWFALMEGVAAGAMLTMISETMLPEAERSGGAITGASTLLGFLTAIFFKTFD
jgi:CRP-like cAMP-binding protein